MQLKFLNFRSKNFAEYKSWYKDIDLNRELGPMDQEFLTAVLNNKDGQEYSVFNEGKLVAVVGIKFPTIKHPYYFITDIAVKPSLKNQGIGSEVLRGLIKLHPLKNGQS